MSAMPRTAPAPDPDACLASLERWRRDRVTRLRAAAPSPPGIAGSIAGEHPVDPDGGPVCRVGAEASRGLYGVWRGRRLSALEPGHEPGGTRETTTIAPREGDRLATTNARRLVRAAVAPDHALCDPARAKVR